MTNEMINGVIVYGGIALLTAIFADFSVRKSSKPLNLFFVLLTLLTPSIFAGLRYGIGTDYFNYLNGFNNIKYNLGSNTEFLYYLLNKVVASLGLGFQTVLFISSFITTMFIYLALYRYRHKVNIGLGMFVYILLFYQISFNGIRQIIAMAILLFSIKYILERRLLFFTLAILLAMGFHKTAILFYPFYFLYFLYGTNRYKVLKLLSFSILIILMINFSSILFPIFQEIESISYYTSSYLDSEREFSIGIGYLFRTLPYIIPGVIFSKSLRENKELLFIFNVVIIGCITLLTAYSSTNFTERISYYFLSSLIIFVPYIYRLSKIKRKKYIGIIVVLCVIILWYIDFILLGRNGTIPYETILSV